MDEKDALKVKLNALVDEGRLLEYKLQGIALCRADFFDTLVNVIREKELA